MSSLARYVAILAIAVIAPSCSMQESTAVRAVEQQDCTRTQGYWKNHPEAWPVSSLSLGSVSYTKSQLLAIYGKSVSGNGLVALAHQLITAKLNVAFGADDSQIADAIADADAMIGGLVVPPVGNGYLPTSQTSALNDELDGFNNSNGACAPEPVCGDGTVDNGEVCDDGNTTNGDGCSSTCMPEPPPPPPPACGDGTVDAGESCDDGNTSNGDGCSATCTVEPAGPQCGNGVLESGEECDDGNTMNGDGCSSTCVCEPAPPPEPVCGNGVVEGSEQCDDGNTHSGDGCSASCVCEPTVNATQATSVFDATTDDSLVWN